MKFLKFASVTLLSLAGLAALLFFIGAGINWRDQPPSAAALEMKEILTGHVSVAERDNGFVYAMGFSAPEAADPQALGAKRVTWIEIANRDSTQIDTDPVKVTTKFEPSPSMQALRESCTREHSTGCRDAFAAAQTAPRSALENLQLSRYRELVKRAAWLEVVPLDVRVPMAAFGDIVQGQRLLYVDLAVRVKSAPAAEIAQELRADLAFWRETQKSSGYLVTKMIAVAALRQHFFFGNLVLREIPGGHAELIEAWSVPMSAEELSMRRVMAGELAFAEANMRRWHDGTQPQAFVDPEDPRMTLKDRIATLLARPYYQPQDQINYYAQAYLDIVKRFEVPLDQYLEAEREVQEMQPKFSFHVYNLTGYIFRSISGPGSFASYPVRVASVEGQRRAALLTAQLRSRGTPAGSMAVEVSRSGLRDPFDLEPFDWDEDDQAVVYLGPAAEGSRMWHPYFY